jgi:predicted permease
MPEREPYRPFQLPWQSRAEIDAELEAELAHHLELRREELMAGGLNQRQAHEEAMRRFGDLDEARRYCRALDRERARTIKLRDLVTGWRQDLTFAVRQLVRNPGFTAVTILTLALGIGANTAIFSMVQKLVLSPLPYRASDRLALLMESSTRNSVQIYPDHTRLQAWRARAHTITGVESFSGREVTLTGLGDPVTLKAGSFSPGLPALLGVAPVIGRGFRPDEAVTGGAPVAMLGYGLWRRAFGGRSDALGKSITIDGHDYTIVGVMPRDFNLPFFDVGASRQLWLPLVPDTINASAGAIGRLRDGATLDEVTKELTAIDKSDARTPSRGVEFTGQAIGLQRLAADSVRKTLLILFGVVGLVLLIACANVANLLLTRASARSREFAIRAALGAGRGRVIRQLLTESTCLAMLGGTLGVLLAWKGLDLIAALRPASLSMLDDVRLEPVALVWTLLISLATGVLFGLAPSLFASEQGLNDSLRGGAGAGGHRRSRRLRAGLVVGEVALAVTLLIGAGLLLRTVVRLQNSAVGFESAELTGAQINLPPEHFSTKAAYQNAFEQMATAVRRIPGVTDVAITGGVPLQSGIMFGELEREGGPLPDNQKIQLIGFVGIQSGYFTTMRLPVLQGREPAVEAGDKASEAVINQSMAKRIWPGENALGKRFRMTPGGDWTTVVGVVTDVFGPGRRNAAFDLQAYFRSSVGTRSSVLLIRTMPGTDGLPGAIRRQIAAIDPLITVPHIDTMQQLIDESIAGQRFTTTLFAIFAGLALALSTIGLYGVIAYGVSQRTREIGVRIALGATASAVIRLVVGQGLRLTLLGVVLGVAAAAAGTRLIQSMLFGVSALDPLTFVLVALLLTTVAAAAAYLPARRAARVDPTMALRAE